MPGEIVYMSMSLSEVYGNFVVTIVQFCFMMKVSYFYIGMSLVFLADMIV